MKIIFFGSDDFANAHLESLIASDHIISACVTQPDRPKGRGMKVVQSPIKTCAVKNNIEVLQPNDIKTSSFEEQLKNFNTDLFVVIAYGRILSLSILDIPGMGAINVHASLLPKYRGAAPINWAIINGEKETGLTIIKINPQMDAGDILSQANFKIGSEDTSISIRAKMLKEGPSLLLSTVKTLRKGEIKARKQDERKVTLAPKLTKEMGLIQWDKPAGDIHNLTRGLLPWPSAYTYFKGKMLKVLSTEVVKDSGLQVP